MAKASKKEIAEFLDSEFLKALVANRAWQLHGMFDEPCPDVEDIEQELMIYLIKGLPKHNPKKGTLEALAITIVDSKKWNIIRHFKAKMRNEDGFEYLDAPLSSNSKDLSGDGVPDLRDVIDEGMVHSHQQVHRRNQPWHNAMSHDLEIAMKELRQDLFDLAVRLMYQSPKEVAKATGVPYSTICDREKQILKVFERYDLEKYLGERPYFRRAKG